MLRSVATVSAAQKAWVFGAPRMLSKKNFSSLQFYTNELLILIIMNFLQYILYRFILLIQFSRVSNGHRGVLIAVVQQYTFQRSLTAVDEQSQFFVLILRHSKLVLKQPIYILYNKAFHSEKKWRIS